MNDELMNFDIPVENTSIIKVIGVGGGGSNAVNHMYRQGIKDVDFVVCNTDAQALQNSPVKIKIQLGASSTEGRGAGNVPSVGREAAIENLEDVIEVLANHTKMVFITAGMGGGTGTGAAPVIAKAAKELKILTVAIVTIPFRNEGQRRINQALEGISEIEKHVDSLLVVNNEKIREIYGDLPVSEAFAKADDILATAAKGIAEIITVHSYINVDFADVETVMTNSGVAIMGTGVANGPDRAVTAVTEAMNSPLLNDNDIKGAKNILINITSGTTEITMDEIGRITDYIQDCAGEHADVIWGNGIDEGLGEKLRVTLIATGFEMNSIPQIYFRKRELDKVPLEDGKEKNGTLNTESTGEFQVREVKPPHRSSRESNISSQQEIDFEIRRTSDVRSESTEDFRVRQMDKNLEAMKAANRVKSLKNYERIKEMNMNSQQASASIEEMESQPAYERRKFELDNSEPSKERKISKFSLKDNEDPEKKAKLSDNNPYFEKNANVD